jgi:transposase
MVLMRKVEKNEEEDSKELEKKRQKFISNAEKKKVSKDWVRMLLRIRSDFIEYIDESIKDQLNSSRTSWILETIQERIQREKKRK